MTSDERRKVAERLRVYSHDFDFGDIDPHPFLYVMKAVFADCKSHSYYEIFARLADLIEPQEIDENTSDGYHTFGQLYYQRMMLFAVLVKEHKAHSWKTRRHEDGKPCFGGGWFLVTIDTPDGPYGYHYEDTYWDLFDCKELPKAKHWDGYDENDVWRLTSLASADSQERTCDVVPLGERLPHCSLCGQPMLRPWHNYCPSCGARVTDGGED